MKFIYRFTVHNTLKTQDNKIDTLHNKTIFKETIIPVFPSFRSGTDRTEYSISQQ